MENTQKMYLLAALPSGSFFQLVTETAVYLVLALVIWGQLVIRGYCQVGNIRNIPGSFPFSPGVISPSL